MKGYEESDPLLGSVNTPREDIPSVNVVIPLILAGITSLAAVEFGYCLGYTSPIDLQSGSYLGKNATAGIIPNATIDAEFKKVVGFMCGDADGVLNQSSLTTLTNGTFADTYVANEIHILGTHKCKHAKDKVVTFYGGLRKEENALFGSLVNVGAMVGALLGGTLVDSLGRLRTVTVACVPYALGYFAIYFCPAGSYIAAVLLGARVVLGIAVGLSTVSVPLYISETAPSHLRGGLGCMFQVGVVVGILYVYAIGIPVFEYRTLALIGTIVPCALLVLTLFLPKSPRFLLSKMKLEETSKALQVIRGANADIEAEKEEMLNALKANENEDKASIGDLFKGSTGSAMKIAAGLMVFQQFSGINCVIFFATEIFKSAGIENAATGSLITGIVQVVVTVLSCIIIDKTGRRALLMTAGTGMFSALVVLGFYYKFKEENQNPEDFSKDYGKIAIASVISYVSFFSLGLGAIPWLMMSEIFPARTRGLAASVATCLNWTLSFIITETFGTLKDNIGNAGTFWLFAGVCIFGVTFVLTVVPETKGKSLEEIEDYFAGRTTDGGGGGGGMLVAVTAGVTITIGLILVLDMNGTFGGSAASHNPHHNHTLGYLLDSTADFGPQ